MDQWERPMAGRRGSTVALAIVLLAVAWALALYAPGATAVLPTSALAALAAVWVAGLALPRPALARTIPAVLYYAGLLAVLCVLIVWNPWFMLVSWTSCLYAFALFEARWAFGGAAAAGVTLTMAQARSPLPESGGSLPLFLVSLVLPLIAGGWYLGRESDARRRLIARLEQTNRDLATASATNIRLQDRLLDQSRAAGAQQERQRMAREIHDTLAQDLSAVVAQLEVALAAGDERNWRDRVTQARDQAREGLSEARRSVRALAPRSLDDAALPEALRRLTQRWRERMGVAASCQVDPDLPALPAHVEAALVRVTQAALANVAEHAAASHVRVTLSSVDDAVLLDIRDDGVGFEPDRVPSGAGDRGFGLDGMRQRLGQLGGRLAVESAPGAGTTICARVPAATGAR